MSQARASMGQVLVLFCLFLVVLLGISALAIDYASWLLVDRNLQNTADHAVLAGASEFQNRAGGTNCSGSKCINARAQAWTSLNDELRLGLSATTITCLASVGPDQGDSPAGGEPNSARASTGGCSSEPPVDFRNTIWVTTPPRYAAYTNAGGRYEGNQGIVFVRVDRAVRSFLGGVLGIQPAPRTGWATAGALPTGLAMQTFCRNGIPPQSGSCGGSGQTSLVIDGQGGIRLISGDLGSNESLKVTANGGSGVVLNDGNVFVVNGSCSNALWRCPNGPPSLGGISDAFGNGKNAFYMAPQPVPRYESPLDYASLSVCSDTVTWDDVNSPNYHVPCVPYRNQSAPDPAPSLAQWVGNWTCDTGIPGEECGSPNLSTTPVSCTGGSFDRFYRPNVDNENPSRHWRGSQYDANGGGGNRYLNINETPGQPGSESADPTGSLPATVPGSAPITGTPANWVSSQDGSTNIYRVGLDGVEGVHVGGSLTVRYSLFRTVNRAIDAAVGPLVPVTVSLKERVGSTYITRGTPDSHDASEAMMVHQFDVPTASMSGPTWYNNLYLEFQVATAVPGYGAGVSWAEVEEENLQPREAPRIPPGYWKSITIPAGKCAILDPSHATGVQLYQLPGVFRFGGNGTGSSAPRIVIGAGGYLIGDAVSFVFDARVGDNGFPNKGIDIGTGGALVINTGATTDPPLTALPYLGMNAAWQIDPADTTNPRNGENTWPVCTRGGNECVPRSCYMNTDPDPTGVCVGQTVSLIPGGRGIAFYLTPNTWTHASVQIQNRLDMSGSGQIDAPALWFRGILYAPYDDIKISGRDCVNTVGQVLAWTAKFNGGSACILLEYPYTDEPAAPYLLEPTIDH